MYYKMDDCAYFLNITSNVTLEGSGYTMLEVYYNYYSNRYDIRY